MRQDGETCVLLAEGMGKWKTYATRAILYQARTGAMTPAHPSGLVAWLCLAGLAGLGTPSALPQAARSEPESASAPEIAPAQIQLRELRPGVWLHTSYYTYPGRTRLPANGIVVRDGDGLLLVDTAWGEMLTAALLDRIQAEIGLPVRRAVVTHSRYDRVAGVDLLEERGVQVHTSLASSIRAAPARVLGPMLFPGFHSSPRRSARIS